MTVTERKRPSATVAGRVRGELEGGTPVEAHDLPELSFVHPLPGFPGLRRYVLVRLQGDEGSGNSAVAEGDAAAGDAAAADAAAAVADAAGAPAGAGSAGAGEEAEDGDGPVLYELRSVDKPDLSFLVGVPRAFFPDYAIELDDQSCDDLDLHEPGDALVLVILSAGPDPASTTANLMAPVVINSHNRTAAQVILSGSDWPVRALIA
jgi:flagellar assembly factor FliW